MDHLLYKVDTKNEILYNFNSKVLLYAFPT